MSSSPLKTYTKEDYYNLPDNVRAELIEGQFYDTPFPNRIHQEILGELLFTIQNYNKAKGKPYHVFAARFAVELANDDKTIVEPDISIICDANKLTDKGCSGTPDWIIEIVSPSNPKYDYITKLRLYHDAGVREYWIVDPQNKKIYVYNMEEVTFTLNAYSFHDTIEVGIFDDLSIDFSSLGLDV